VAIIEKDGFYLVILRLATTSGTPFRAEVEIDMKGPHGYLSASDWPLMLVRFLRFTNLISIFLQFFGP